jgi:DnaJ homolog subfamily C member 19
MGRLLFFAVIAVIGCRLLTGRWPWDFLFPRPSTRSQAIFHARKLLAVRAGAGRSEILEAHRRLVTLVHPDRGGTNDQMHEANAARDLLLEELTDKS